MSHTADNVNVRDHATEAADRGRTHRRLQGVMDASRKTGEPWWSKYFKWEHNLTVAGRTIEKGWVVPQPLGIALIVVMLGGVGTLYWRVTDKVSDSAREVQQVREMLIRVDQRLIDKNDHDQQRFQELKQSVEDVKEHNAAVEYSTSKEIALLKAKVK